MPPATKLLAVLEQSLTMARLTAAAAAAEIHATNPVLSAQLGDLASEIHEVEEIAEPIIADAERIPAGA
jgi:hypothetical protein